MISIYIYTYIFIYRHTDIQTYRHTDIHTHIYICIYKYTYDVYMIHMMLVRLQVHYMCACVYDCICIII